MSSWCGALISTGTTLPLPFYSDISSDVSGNLKYVTLLRTTMPQDRLSGLATLSIERETLNLDYSDMIKEFVARKVNLKQQAA
jgi:hypothetical protein